MAAGELTKLKRKTTGWIVAAQITPHRRHPPSAIRKAAHGCLIDAQVVRFYLPTY
tara:strand:+ start:3806 stop:3970 length:165 start_codon:yes stop_codon:yes gene_type:complete